MKKIKLIEIARVAGVSITCVSLVRNGKARRARISCDTIQRVQVAIAEAGMSLMNDDLPQLSDVERWKGALQKIALGHPNAAELAKEALQEIHE